MCIHFRGPTRSVAWVDELAAEVRVKKICVLAFREAEDVEAFVAAKKNGRDDKVFTSKFWQSSFEERRCLVPASSYCERNALTRSINHERMPVLLDSEVTIETWVSGTPKEACALVKSCETDEMRIVQSGFEKKDLLAA